MASAALRRTAACGSGGRAVAAAQRGGVGGEIESFPHLFPCRFDEFFFYPRNFRKHVVTKNHSLTLRESRCHSRTFESNSFQISKFYTEFGLFYSSSPRNDRDFKRSKSESVFHSFSSLFKSG